MHVITLPQCKVTQNTLEQFISLGHGIMTGSVEFQKDLGILFDNQFKFHLHTTEVAAKANHLLGLIRRSFDHLDLDMSSLNYSVFVTLVHPTLEYCNLVWGPSFALDQRKIEKAQRRAIRILAITN